MLSSIIDSSMATRRWMDRDSSSDVGGVIHNKERSSYLGTTAKEAGVFSAGRKVGVSKPRSTQKHSPQPHQRSKKPTKVSFRKRRYHPAPVWNNNHSRRHSTNRAFHYRPTQKHRKNETTQRNNISLSYQPVHPSQKLGGQQYKKKSPLYYQNAKPNFSVAGSNSAHKSLSPVYVGDLSTFSSSSPPLYYFQDKLTTMVGGPGRQGVVSYSPTSPAYTYQSPMYNNKNVSPTQPPPNTPTISMLQVQDNKNDAETSFKFSLQHKSVDAGAAREETSRDHMGLLKKRIAEAIGKDNSNSTKHYSRVAIRHQESDSRRERRLAYDPTQPQYSPSYDPAIMVDNWYDLEAMGKVAYDPERPQYFPPEDIFDTMA